MALLEGLLGGANMVQQFGQQQFQNKLATNRLGEQKRQYDKSFEESVRQSDRTYDEQKRQSDRTYNESVRQFNVNDVYNSAKSAQDTDKFNTEKTTAAHDKLWKTYKTAGLLTPDGLKIDTDVLTQRVKDGDPVAEQVILGMATQFGDLPPGSTATEIQQLPDGGYAVTVTNADGSQGVMTVDGTSEPTSEVMNFEAGELSRLAAAEFGMNVITDLTVFDGVSAVNQGAKANADAGRQSILDDLKVQRDALNAIPPGGLKRGATFAIANAKTPEDAKAVVNQIIIDTGQATTNTAGAATSDASQTGAESTQATTPWSMDNVDERTDGGKIIRAIEGRGVTKPPPARVEKQRVKLGAYREELVNKIKTSEANRARFKVKTPPPERDGVLKNKAELAMIDGYLDKDKAASVFPKSKEIDSIVEATGSKTTEEVEAALNSGEVQMSKKAIAANARTLIANKITKLEDLLRLNAKDQAVARVAILASEEDPVIRAQMSRELTNLFDNTENSPNMKRTDEITADGRAADRAYKNKKLGQDARTAYRGWVKEATGEAQKVVAGVNIRYFGENYDEDNLDANTASAVMKSKEMSDFQIYLKNSNLTRGEIKTAVVGLKSVMSTTMAALAGDQTGGPWESILDLIGRDETTDVVDPFDFDASRIIVDDPENPTKIYYTDADGNYTDEDAGLQKLKDLAPSFYENVRAIGIANRRARDKQPAAQG